MAADLRSGDWEDEDFRSQLKGRLGPADETLDNWLFAAQDLNETLRIVIERFRLPPESVRRTSATPSGMYTVHKYIYLFRYIYAHSYSRPGEAPLLQKDSIHV